MCVQLMPVSITSLHLSVFNEFLILSSSISKGFAGVDFLQHSYHFAKVWQLVDRLKFIRSLSAWREPFPNFVRDLFAGWQGFFCLLLSYCKVNRACSPTALAPSDCHFGDILSESCKVLEKRLQYKKGIRETD